MRLGIFGGSFDPVHYGHLLLAETCREQARLDEIRFVPTAMSPHKVDAANDALRATPQQRAEMLQLAIGGHAALSISTWEVEKGGVSYTVDTLAKFAGECPEAALFLLMGADSLAELPSWRDPDRICQLAIPLVVRRRGAPEPNFDVLAPCADPQRLEVIRRHAIQSPVVELSSTDLRQRVRDDQSIRFRTPRAVEQYILAEGLYRP